MENQIETGVKMCLREILKLKAASNFRMYSSDNTGYFDQFNPEFRKVVLKAYCKVWKETHTDIESETVFNRIKNKHCLEKKLRLESCKELKAEAKRITKANRLANIERRKEELKTLKRKKIVALAKDAKIFKF